MSNNIFAIILAGGSGSRLWPLSRELHPKQLMQFTDDYTLFQSAFIRLVNNVDDKNIVTATNAKHDPQVRYQLEALQNKFFRQTPYRVITEPLVKNTAPAVALGIKYIQQINKSEDEPIIIVTPSDHFIPEPEGFSKIVDEAVKLAKEGYIVTFGVKPSKPDTGYGYIRAKKNRKIREISESALKVDYFSEKPDEASVREYCESDKYYWNSGIYVFKASVLLAEYKKYAPQIYEIIQNAQIGSQIPTIPYLEYEQMPDISIDYAVMEYSKKLAMLPMECEWHDLGSWEAIYDISEKDEHGNSVFGNVIDLDSENSMIYSTSKLVTTIGLKDLVVVETEDAFLVCEKSRTQDVKKVFNKLKEKNDSTHLVHKTVYRPWGYYTVLNEGSGFLTKCIQVNPGGKLSLQLHHHRSEHWVVLEGNALVIHNDEEHYLSPGDSIDIGIEETHSLQNPYDEPIKILEVQRGEILDENDIVRLKDIYGRV